VSIGACVQKSATLATLPPMHQRNW